MCPEMSSSPDWLNQPEAVSYMTVLLDLILLMMVGLPSP